MTTAHTASAAARVLKLADAKGLPEPRRVGISNGQFSVQLEGIQDVAEWALWLRVAAHADLYDGFTDAHADARMFGVEFSVYAMERTEVAA